VVRTKGAARTQGGVIVRKLILASFGVLAACASPGAPPGGPPLLTPPEVIAVTPDSGMVETAPRAVVFRFDRVISEQARGAQTLAGNVIISPSDGIPRVSWQRNALSVRPRRSWQPNTAYTVTLLPGITDLRGNVLSQRVITVFSTGAVIPQSRIEGVVFDWVAGSPAAQALVEARRLPDSTLFLTQADSVGRYVLHHLPAGDFHVRAFADLNRNRDLDAREPWDTLTVALQDSARVEFLTYVRDTLPPVITQVVATDSVTLRAVFGRPISPGLELTPAMFTLTDAENQPLGITAVLRLNEWEAARREATDTAVAAPAPPRAGALPTRPPATTPIPRPEPSRPPPATTLVLTLAQPVAGGAEYRLRGEGVEGMRRTSAPTERPFTVPRAQAVPATPAPADPEPPPVR
jgi:hypothetical protein